MIFLKYQIPCRMLTGIKELIRSRVKRCLFFGYILFWGFDLFKQYKDISGFIEYLEWLLLGFYGVIGILVVLVIIGIPFYTYKVKYALQKIGFQNCLGEVPTLLESKKLSKKSGKQRWKFANCGISLEDWSKKTDALAAALNMSIESIDYGKDMQEIVMEVFPPKRLPKFLKWEDNLLLGNQLELLLGESRTGPVTVNLLDVPHCLVGGSTGSGKSALTKLMIWQLLLMENVNVHIIDFKAGIDYGSKNFRECSLYLDVKEALDLLDRMVLLIKERQAILRGRAKDINHYNTLFHVNMKHEVIFLDELAEILDTGCVSKEEERTIKSIEQRLKTIARIGRAEGIHLVISMQRPSHEALTGQIKNNIDFRVCGRAEMTLSRIILDSSDAAWKIPKNARGRFLTNEGVVFQAYYLEEEWEVAETAFSEDVVVLEDELEIIELDI